METPALPDGDSIQRDLQKLQPSNDQAIRLARIAKMLTDMPLAWRKADQEQRNRLAKNLFKEIWIEDKRVVAVVPQAELEPFFELDWKQKETHLNQCQGSGGTCGSDGIRLRKYNISGQLTSLPPVAVYHNNIDLT